MSDLLHGVTPVKARHIRPGQGQAVEIRSGQYLQIQTLQGKQVADFVAFSSDDPEEYLSTSVTRSSNANIVPKKEMTLYTNRREGMFEIVEDTVGRHDMLYACCDPIRYEQLGAPGHANCREALTEALASHGIGYDRIPTPINWFMNVSIMQRGELDIREPLAEKDDFVLLRALKDVIAAVSACPQDLTATNGFAPSDLRIRVFPADALLARARAEAETAGGEAAGAAEANGSEPDRDGAAERVARRAERRAARRAAATGEGDAAGTESETEPADGANDDVAAPGETVTAETANANPTPRPARLGDTAEATVIRVE